MKYLKLYEEKSQKHDGDFYYIPYNTLNLISLAIDKIDTTEEMKKILKDSVSYSIVINKDIPSVKIIGVYIGVTYHLPDEQYWICTSNADKKAGYKTFLEDCSINFTYKGEIKLEDWEITSNKYNI